ncbi:MAG: hypothetical protein WDM91_18210 [Rhizomicrobium sp.]
MFFISWGSRVCRRIFGEPSVHDCDICREQRTFRNMVIYKVYHVWWLFRWVVNKDFIRVCTVCNNGVRIDEHDVVPKGAKSPIPFMDRMGWAAGLGGVAALAAMVSVAGAAQSHREDAWLSQPEVNDVYEVDLAKLTTNPEASVMYSTLEVVRVSGGAVDVRLPKTYFDKMSGVASAVRDGRAKSPDFYSDKVMSIQVAALHKMHNDGAILSVDR